jgi:signal peptidase I
MTSSYGDPQKQVLAPQGTTPAGSLRGGPWQRGTQSALQALWVGIIPTLLAALVFRLLVPPIATGPAGIVAQFFHRFWLPFGVGLFFLFSGMARYWRFRVPGGRYASRLPAHLVAGEKDPDRLAEWASAAALYELFVLSKMRQRLRRTPDEGSRTALGRQLDELRAGLETGDYGRANGAARAIEALAARGLASRRRSEALGVIAAVVVAVAAALGVRAMVEPYRVLSGSMLPTLEQDDLLVSNRLAYRSLLPTGRGAAARRLPRRGDLILFRSGAVAMRQAGGPDLLVKRVIGLPGDQIGMRGDVPVLNGWMVPFCSAGQYLYIAPDGEVVRGTVRVEFLEDRVYLTLQSLWTAFEGPYTVQPGEVFVLGDSRSNSVDSRAWNEGHGGGVPLDAISGRAQWLLWGQQRSGDADNAWLRPLDAVGRRAPVGGPEAQKLKDGIANCLRTPPAVTRPPEPPSDPLGAHTDRRRGT